MNSKTLLLLFLSITFGCGVKGKPRPSEGTERFKPFNKIYQKDVKEEGENKKDKKSK